MLRLRLRGRDRAGPGDRCLRRPHLLRQHDQEGEGHRAAPYQHGVRLFAVDSEAELREARAPGRVIGATASGVLPRAAVDCERRRVAAQHASSAARRRWPRTCSRKAQRLGLRAPTASRSMSARSRPIIDAVGQGAGPASRSMFATLAERGIDLKHGQSWAAASRPRYLKPTFNGGRRPTARRSISVRWRKPFRQPHPGDDHRAGPRHGRQCRHDPESEVVLISQQGGRGRSHALGLSRHRQVLAVSPRPWTRRSSYPTPHGPRRRRAWRPVRARRPDLRFGRRAVREEPRTSCRVSLKPSATRSLIEATGAYTTTYSSVGFNGFAPLKAICI